MMEQAALGAAELTAICAALTPRPTADGLAAIVLTPEGEEVEVEVGRSAGWWAARWPSGKVSYWDRVAGQGVLDGMSGTQDLFCNWHCLWPAALFYPELQSVWGRPGDGFAPVRAEMVGDRVLVGAARPASWGLPEEVEVEFVLDPAFHCMTRYTREGRTTEVLSVRSAPFRRHPPDWATA